MSTLQVNNFELASCKLRRILSEVDMTGATYFEGNRPYILFSVNPIPLN
jgi:hypothetical protein